MMEDLTQMSQTKKRTIGLDLNKPITVQAQQNQRDDSVDDVSSISAQPNTKFQKDRIITKLFPNGEPAVVLTNTKKFMSAGRRKLEEQIKDIDHSPTDNLPEQQADKISQRRRTFEMQQKRLLEEAHNGFVPLTTSQNQYLQPRSHSQKQLKSPLRQNLYSENIGPSFIKSNFYPAPKSATNWFSSKTRLSGAASRSSHTNPASHRDFNLKEHLLEMKTNLGSYLTRKQYLS